MNSRIANDIDDAGHKVLVSPLVGSDYAREKVAGDLDIGILQLGPYSSGPGQGARPDAAIVKRKPGVSKTITCYGNA